MKDKKAFYKKMLIISFVLLVFIILCIVAGPFVYLALLPLFVTVEGVIVSWHELLHIAIAFVLYIIAVTAIFASIWFIVYLVGRIYLYISLVIISTVKGHKFKITRPLFASMKGVSSIADIEISTMQGTLCLHFVDIINPYKLRLTRVEH